MTIGTAPTAMRIVERAEVRMRYLASLAIAEASTEEQLAEAIRAELTARTTAIRAELLRSLQEQLNSFAPTSSEELLAVCRRLEWIGEITTATNGAIAAAPLRALPLDAGTFLLVGTAATWRMQRAGAKEIIPGIPRRIHCSEAALKTWLSSLGGMLVPLERWSKLERATSLEQVLPSLEARAEAPNRYERTDAVISWRNSETYVPNPSQPLHVRRWSREALPSKPCLVRATQPGGWTAYAWMQPPVSGVSAQRISLSKDEARRVMFALDAGAGASVSLELLSSGTVVELRSNVLFPSAEFRYLLAMSERIETTKFPLQFFIPQQRWSDISAMLTTRLGVSFRSTG